MEAVWALVGSTSMEISLHTNQSEKIAYCNRTARQQLAYEYLVGTDHSLCVVNQGEEVEIVFGPPPRRDEVQQS